MKAIAIYPGKGDPHLLNTEEPKITDGNSIKAEVLSVGICGTDRDEVSGERAEAPAGSEILIIGHEMFCRVVETGKEVKSTAPGDYGVFTVRRGCGQCVPCSINRSDMCITGRYRERGIKQLHGYQSEFIVDSEQYFIKGPEEIMDIAVLTEPASIAEKAISEAMLIQNARIPGDQKDGLWNRKALIAGIGTVGLLAAFILCSKGAKVWGLDIVDEHSLRPSLLKQMGGTYINGKTVTAENIDDIFGGMDLIFESAGISELGFDLIDALGVNGIYVMTGIPEGDRRITIPGSSLMRQMVLKNQVLLGSVNASKIDFHSAVKDLSNPVYAHMLRKMITRTIPVSNYMDAFSRSSDDIKTIIQWKEA